MISPHTPPGTKVVMIRQGYWHGGEMPAPSLNEVLTVREIRPSVYSKTGAFVATFDEREIWVDIILLRRIDLPECVTSLLNVTPVDGDLVVSKADPAPLHPPCVLPAGNLAPGARLYDGGPVPGAFSQFV